MANKNFAVIGGDERIVQLIKLLKKDGNNVKVFGFDKKEGLEMAETLESAIIGADFVVGAIPFSKDGITVHAEYSKENIFVLDIVKAMNGGQKFIAGYILPDVEEILNIYGIEYVDLLKLEEVAIANAVPTAEGAIKVAIENTDFTLCGAEVLVIGFGRVGSVLANMLDGMGAYVSVVTRGAKNVNLARSFGHKVYENEFFDECLKDKNIIFNTVPVTQMDENNIKFIEKETLIVDVASSPFGINPKNTGELKVIYAGSLPGRTAPFTVGKCLKEALYKEIGL